MSDDAKELFASMTQEDLADVILITLQPLREQCLADLEMLDGLIASGAARNDMADTLRVRQAVAGTLAALESGMGELHLIAEFPEYFPDDEDDDDD